MNLRRQAEILRFIKYCMVGGLNTLLTLGVIFLCKSVFGIDPYVSNAAGYVVGLVNSFMWNKRWVFRSQGTYRREAVRFVLGFVVCYALQLGAVWMLNRSPFGLIEIDLGMIVISGYGLATLLGNILYTLANFLYNRLVTFR
ncbi:MAG: GtrA family protein [Bacteroidales bacterium]|nr:GtrA family protein [Bacteroidales bacterium]